MPELNSDQVAQYVYDQASKAVGQIFYVSGPSLSGRTYICKQLELGNVSGGSWRPKVYSHTCKTSDLGHELITQPLKKIFDRHSFSRGRAKRLLKKGLPGLLKAGRAVASAVFPAIPSEIDKLIDSLASAATESGHERFREFPQSGVDSLLEILAENVQEVGGDGILLVVDALEELAAPGLLLIDALLQAPISGLTVVVTANDEFGATKQKEHQRVRARLQQKSISTIVTLVGHSPAEISNWKRRRSGILLDSSEANMAYERSMSGRSGLLARWMESSERTPELIDAECARLYGHLDLEFASFPTKAQQVVALLAQAYPDAVSIPELSQSLEIKRDEILAVRDLLTGAFARDTERGLVLRRKSVFNYACDRLGVAIVGANWNNGQLGINLPAAAHGGNMIGFSTDQRLSAIERDLHRGAVQAAYERIEAALRLIEDAATTKKSQLLRYLADVYEQRGQYKQALVQLDQAATLTLDQSEQCRIRLEAAENHFRLGETFKSIKELNWVRKNSNRPDQLDIWLKAVLRTISVFVERDKNQSAIKLAEAALDRCMATAPNTRVKCHVLRTAARAMVLSGSLQDRALSLAQDAVQLAAQQPEERRTMGNCLYALGDVQRHRGQYVQAHEKYRDALAHSESNFDLKVYCHLGVAAVAVASDDEKLLRSSLEELSQLPIDTDSPESKSVRALSFLLSNLDKSLDSASCDALAGEIQKGSKRHWQLDLLRTVERFRREGDPKKLRNEVRRITIVL